MYILLFNGYVYTLLKYQQKSQRVIFILTLYVSVAVLRPYKTEGYNHKLQVLEKHTTKPFQATFIIAACP